MLKRVFPAVRDRVFKSSGKIPAHKMARPLLFILLFQSCFLRASIAVYRCHDGADCDYTGCNDRGEAFYCTLGHCGYREGEGFFVCIDPPPCRASPGHVCQSMKDLPEGRRCPEGKCCPGGTAEAAPCLAPPGRYCATGSAACAGRLCPPGHFCTGGSELPRPCVQRDGWYCPAGSTSREGVRIGAGLHGSSVGTVWQMDGFHVDLHNLGIILIVVGFCICLIVL